MTDTLKEIFSGQVSYTDMESGSHTLFTTDANTQYVIKDVHVKFNDSRRLKDVTSHVSWKVQGSIPAEINGYEIGDFTTDLSGHEIMGANSSLNITTDSFNVIKRNIQFYCVNDSGDLVLRKIAFNFPSKPTVIDTIEVAGGLTDADSKSISQLNEWMKVGSAYYQVVRDSNAHQRVNYWSSSASVKTVLNSTGNYYPCCLDHTNGVAYYIKEAGTDDSLYKHTPGGGEELVVSGINETDWSSYPMMYLIDNWMWICEEHTSTQVHAIRLDGGAVYYWPSVLIQAGSGDGTRMWVTKDTAQDKYVVWRTGGHMSNASYFFTPQDTITTMNAASGEVQDSQSNGGFNAPSTWSSAFDIDEYSTSDSVYWRNSVVLPDPDNPYAFFFFWRGTAGSEFDADFDDIRVSHSSHQHSISPTLGNLARIEKESWPFHGNYFTELPRLSSTIALYTPDSTEIGNTTYDESTFLDVRITGIEVTS